jgi:hypothetical protein
MEPPDRGAFERPGITRKPATYKRSSCLHNEISDNINGNLETVNRLILSIQ